MAFVRLWKCLDLNFLRYRGHSPITTVWVGTNGNQWWCAGSFEQEKKLYVDPTQPLGRFLPQLHSIAEPPDGCLLDVFGQPMPPCIIMEKGEAMDVWVDKSGEDMDMFTGLSLIHI